MGSLGFNTGWERYDTIYGDGGNIGMGWDGMGWGRIRSSGHTRAMYRSKHHKSSLMVWPKHIYNILLHTVCKHMLAPVENSLLCLFHLT